MKINWKIVAIIFIVLFIWQSLMLQTNKMTMKSYKKTNDLYGEILEECLGMPECSYNAYDCLDFKTQREAQATLEYCGSDDIHHLDGDGDGIACEWNA